MNFDLALCGGQVCVAKAKDKVDRMQTRRAAWQEVTKNAGAAGADGQSLKQFAAREEIYPEELE